MSEHSALVCEALGPCRVVRVEGREAMSELSSFRVDVLSESADVDLRALLRAPATLGIVDPAGHVREVPLLIVSAEARGSSRDGQRYALELATPLAPLALRTQYRVFQGLTTQEIIAQILEEQGFASAAKFRLAGQYERRVYCVQYRESEWGFMLRLLADEGISVWFEEDDGGAFVVVFGDAPSSHDSLAGNAGVEFHDPSGMSRALDSFFELEKVARLTHDRVQLRDFNPRHPDVLIDAAEGEGALEYYEYPANLTMQPAAAARAKVRLEQLNRLRTEVVGRSACARLAPGRIVSIEGAADEFFSGEFLVVSVEHTIHQATRSASDDAKPYTNSVVLVPYARPFRPAIPARVPRYDGIETAEVTGPSGQEIHVDDLGSIKVRFRWDRSGVEDDSSSCWVRHLQLAMHGSMLLPRVGWEVPIVYEDGNPDRPLGLGRLYNGGAPPPYAMPGKKATTTLQSATSPADGTTQEIRLSDDAGSQETFIHATRDQTVTVGGSHTTTTGSERTDDVAKSSEVKISGSQTTTVSGSQSVTVGADAIIGIAGARTVSVAATESIGVTGTQTTTVKGAYTEVVGGLYGLQCNQSNTTVQGIFTQMTGGAMLTTSGLGFSYSVAAAHAESVGGARVINAASAYADEVKGAKNVKAGASTDEAGADILTVAGAAIAMKVGGAASFTAGGAAVITGAKISITAASLSVKGGSTLKVSGSLKASSKVKFKASKTKKTATAKVGS